MGRTARGLQWLGVLVVIASAFVPTLRPRVFPTEDGTSPWLAASFLEGTREVPVAELAGAMYDAFLPEGPAGCPLWHVRQWYPWYLAPVWLAALALVAGKDTPRRRRTIVGGALWGLTAVLLVFEAVYLEAEYLPLLPGSLGVVEGVLAWVFVAGILLYRRKGDRRPGAVEATVASQALLGFVHALTLPSTMGRGWVGAYPLASVVEAVWINFPPPFWIGTAGMLLVALPVYLRRRGSSESPS